MNMRDQLARLTRGAAQIISEAELAEKLSANRPLRVKFGVDPTSADIHLGHSVVLRKLRDFQNLGHTAVLLIGDFTAMIGDPSGRSATRPHLTREEVLANAETYRTQALKVLDEARTEVVFNGDWFRKMNYEDVIRLNSRVTLQQMLQREDFHARIDKQQAIHAHEIQYPIMQGWDSVMVKADVELGGDLPNETHPLEAKKQLALAMVQIYHGADAGRAALEEWTTRFSDKRLSDVDLPSLPATSGEIVGTIVNAYAGAFKVTKSRSE